MAIDDRHGLHPPPWEERHRYGLVNGLVLTMRLALLQPRSLFATMPVGLGLREPLFFAAVMAMIGALLDGMWELTLVGLPLVLGPDFAPGRFLVGPILVVVTAVIQAGLFHLVLHLLHADRFGFEATFRVVTYSLATLLLLVIPVIGGFLATVWQLSIVALGLAAIHGCSLGKAVAAVLAPAVAAIVGFLLLSVAASWLFFPLALIG